MNMNEKTYIITDKKYNIIKVGRSKNPYKRLKTIQISDSIELEMNLSYEFSLKSGSEFTLLAPNVTI